jgi:hypothetical protein
MNRTFVILLFIFIATAGVAGTIYSGYTMPGFVGAGAACLILVVLTVRTALPTKIEDNILKTEVIQQYLLSNFTTDQSTLTYLQKLLREDYNLDVTPEQLLSAIEKEQTKRELESEKEELSDFKNKFFIGKKPQTLDEYIKKFVTVFGRGSARNVYYLKKVLDHQRIPYSDNPEFTDKIIALKNFIEQEIERRGGPPQKKVEVTYKVCPTCKNEYPDVLLYCPFCEQETQKITEPENMVYCPQCNKPMVRSILKRNGTYMKGFQCRNLKCLYEITYEESQNTQ